MPIYEWHCEDCGHREQVYCRMEDRDGFAPEHEHRMVRLPGGHGLLHFEESRPRIHEALSDKPITSKAQHERLMRQNGVVESGDNVPSSVARNPKSIAMKRFMEKDSKRRWV